MALVTKFKPLEVDNNPLLINSVLETLFSHLDLENLKRCRFVCTVWKTEAFRVIRKRAWINLMTRGRQQMFLNSGVAQRFKMFSFNVSKWNDRIAPYLALNEPSNLKVDIDLILDSVHIDIVGNSFQLFENLLTTHAKSLVKLNVHVNCSRSTKLDVPEHLLGLIFLKLRELVIVNGRTEASWIRNLWMAIVRNSSVLQALNLRNLASDELWDGISHAPNFCKLTELRYVHDRKTVILGMHQQLSESQFPVSSLRRLCIPYQDSDVSLISNILRKVTTSLEVLEFYTQDESALSPIDFPVMEKLTTLDAGSSQFSFPSIVPAKFPKLTEIKATYWDWVYTREDLPDVHYYWRASDPHSGITDIHLRLPNWATLDFQYQKLENFNDFSEILQSKFPAARHFYFHNVSLCNDVIQGLEKFSEVYEFTYKTFKIVSYNAKERFHATPFEAAVSEGSRRPRDLEVLDLGSKEWPDIWRREPAKLSTIRDEWLPTLLYFEKLRVLHILWSKNLYGILDLTNPRNLPNLEHFEYVGNRCINRFQRAAVRLSRPQLTIVEHKKCSCPKEDWWYINDVNSGKVFKNLFSTQPKPRGVASFFKKILFDNLLG